MCRTTITTTRCDHAGCDHHHHHDHDDEHVAHHDVTWSGAALGLFLHSLLNGVALAAAVENSHGDLRLAGLGTFLVIFLHKPFDAMTIGMLMARGGYSLKLRQLVNALFSLAIPLGAVVFYFGYIGLTSASEDSTAGLIAAYALAFSAGTFLCISSSDLLPELQFHQHDRGKLSAALLARLGAGDWRGGTRRSYAHGPHAHPAPGRAAPARLRSGLPDPWAPCNSDIRQALPSRGGLQRQNAKRFPALPNRR